VVLEHPTRRRAGSEAPIRVVVAEAHALVRAAYRAMLENEGRIAVVGAAATAREAIARVAETRPAVLVLDLGLPGLDDLQAIARTLAHPTLAGVEVMVLAGSDADPRALGALASGAVGVIAKDTEPGELIRGVRALARGEAFVSADGVRRLAGEVPRRSLDHTLSPEQLAELTEREREVVALVATGLSNADIAGRLVISPATAKTHVTRAMLKLGAHNRAALVVLAYETGLVQPRSPESPRSSELAERPWKFATSRIS
jgi:DNA-binding NarL/FixJ family response regulator